MIILDFLVYYLTKFYEGRPEKLSWSTPVERAVYVVGVITIFWLLVIEEIICFFIIKTTLKIFPIVLGGIIGLLIMQLYLYIYVKKYRFELIADRFEFAMSERKGVILAIVFGFFSFCLPYAIFMIFT
jgi:hypothetical protein